MSATPNAVRHDLTLHTATDQEWQFQRVDSTGTPIVPTSAQAQVRDRPNGALWLTLTCVVAPVTGIITVTAPRALTEGAEWDKRKRGFWDLLVVQGTQRIRIIEGAVEVSPEVTKWL